MGRFGQMSARERLETSQLEAMLCGLGMRDVPASVLARTALDVRDRVLAAARLAALVPRHVAGYGLGGLSARPGGWLWQQTRRPVAAG